MDVPKLTKKQKKGLAFRERKGKKPRPLDSDALPEEELAIPQAELTLSEAQKTLPSTKPKKRKRDAEGDLGDDAAGIVKGEEAEAKDLLPKKNKKRKLEEKDKDNEDKAKSDAGKLRFILFVGTSSTHTLCPLNHPRSRQLEVHDLPRSNKGALRLMRLVTQFVRLGMFCKDFLIVSPQLLVLFLDPPPQVRLLTPKPNKSPPGSTTAKSKGCAFLEFSHRNALQQGLKLHGSTLDGRRINVELTAGGGGKSEKRVQKVQARNKHLLEERVRVDHPLLLLNCLFSLSSRIYVAYFCQFFS
jgi:nucleolar protein 6